jgi:BarA-like signal transduction histidine kinase
LEKEIVSLIQDDYKQEKIIKDLSKRLTAKKLTVSLTNFCHVQKTDSKETEV